MQLNDLRIERKTYGTDKGMYKGYIKFDNELGEISVTLTHEKCEKLFSVVAEGIIDTAKQAAKELTCSVIEHKSQIERIDS
jgi:flagellar biosynthesis/type III secretory pathway protein FliH